MPLKIRKPDLQVQLILLAVVLGILVPISGHAAHIFSLATVGAIALLFFLYGARLSPAEALAGIKHWRLHALILAFTYVVFPLVGVLFLPLKDVLGPELVLGVLFLCVVPSTVQSSIAFTSLAGGNVAGAIVSASLSNLLGVVLTPLLAMLLMSQGSGVHISSDVFGKIALQLFLPFVLGQLSRPWTKKLAASPATKIVDRGSIMMVVYSAFSAGMVEGLWRKVSVPQIVGLAVFAFALVLLMLGLTKTVAKKLGFDEKDQIAVQFCGTKKSLASGLPMAAVIFGNANIGILIVPLMIFHQIQLVVCASLASRYERERKLSTQAQ